VKDKKPTEKDYRDLILQKYTFLKRLCAISGKKIYSGSEKNTVGEVLKLK
jgi:arsenate reductase